MDSVLIFESNPSIAISVAKSLTPLGMSLRSVCGSSDIGHILNEQNVLAVIIGENENRTDIVRSVRLNSPSTLTISGHQSPARLRRKIASARLRSGCAAVLCRAPLSFKFQNDVSLEVPSRTLFFGKSMSVTLALTEFAIMILLSMKEEEIVYKKDILYALWGRADRSVSRALDVHIFALRQKLKISGCPFEIIGVPRIGFVLSPLAKVEAPDFPGCEVDLASDGPTQAF